MKYLYIFTLLVVVEKGYCQNQILDSLFHSAYKMRINGKIHQSIDLYQQALNIDSTNVTHYINQGNNFFEIAEFEKAINAFNQAEKLGGEKYEIYNNRGNAYSKLGKYDSAIQNHKRGIDLKGNASDTILYNIANNYWRMNLLDSANSYFDKVIIYNPNLFEAHLNKAYVLLLKKDYALAQKAYEKLLLDKPKSYSILNNLGYIYLKKGNINKAFSYVNKSLFIKPDNSWGYRNLGLIYMELSNSEKACENLNKALDLEFLKYWGEKDIIKLMDYCEQN